MFQVKDGQPHHMGCLLFLILQKWKKTEQILDVFRLTLITQINAKMSTWKIERCLAAVIDFWLSVWHISFNFHHVTIEEVRVQIEKKKVGCFVCGHCAIPRLSTRCHYSTRVHFLRSSFEKLASFDWQPECCVLLLKESLGRVRSCSLSCSPHATWTCSLRSSHCTTRAWR